MGCNICNAGGQRAINWTRDLNANKRSIQEACIEFSMTPEEVYEHMSSHVIPELVNNVDVESVLNDPAFFYRELYDLFTTMRDWLSFTMETERLDRTTIDTGLKLIKEIRETLKLIAELQGKIKKGNTYQIQYNQIQGEFNVLMGTVLSHACDKCQLEIMNAIENNKQLTGGNK